MKRYSCRWLIALAIVSVVVVFSVAYSSDSGTLNINTASIEELAKIKGIGPKLAEKIIQYRETNGPFQKASDIVNVPGVGPKIWETNQDTLTVGPVPAPPAKRAKSQ
jgi:competence protein ComEA